MLKWDQWDWLFSRYRLAGAVGIFLAILSVGWALAIGEGSPCLKWIVAVWSLVPPLWFFFELHWARARRKDAILERLKESQASAAAVWAGLVAFLTVLYLK